MEPEEKMPSQMSEPKGRAYKRPKRGERVDLADPKSYPVLVSVEECARQMALEVCRMYHLDPRTGARLPGKDANDLPPIPEFLKAMAQKYSKHPNGTSATPPPPPPSSSDK